MQSIYLVVISYGSLSAWLPLPTIRWLVGVSEAVAAWLHCVAALYL
jgi:hypothetical protein